MFKLLILCFFCLGLVRKKNTDVEDAIRRKVLELLGFGPPTGLGKKTFNNEHGRN